MQDKRKYQSMPKQSGIYRILVVDPKSGTMNEPERGALFRSEKYVKRNDGKLVKVRKNFETFAEAKAFRLTTVDVKKQDPAPVARALKFEALVETWVKLCLPNKNISTQIRYRSYLKHFSFFNGMAVEDITPVTVDMWIAHVKTPEYLATGHTTRCDFNHEVSVLKGIFNYYASRNNRNFRQPFLKEHRAMLKVKDKPKVKKDLSIVEVRRFLDALKETCEEKKCIAIYYLAVMQYATYSRIQEAAALHYEDFDFAAGKIRMNKKVQWLRTKGYEDKIVDGAKSNGGKELKMPALAASAFNEWVIRSGIRAGPLFLIKGELVTYRQIENRYNQALKKAGLPFRATHLLRHASLSEFYDTSRDILATQRVAGQSDLRSTMRYAKARDHQVAESQVKMDEKLNVIEMNGARQSPLGTKSGDS